MQEGEVECGEVESKKDSRPGSPVHGGRAVGRGRVEHLEGRA